MPAPPEHTDGRGPVAWMAGHSVAANLVMLVCLVGGFIALRNIKQEVFPDVQIDAVDVSVAYPGASPEEVESGILLSIEEAVRSLEGVYRVTSTGGEGYGDVFVELLVGADPQRASQDIKGAVDRIITFPQEAEKPVVSLLQHRHGVLELVLYGDAPDTVLHELGEETRDSLLQDPDITQVDLEGMPPPEIGIEIPQETLRRYGLTLDEVAARLRAASVDLPGGGLKTESGEILVRVKERRDYGAQFARLPVITTPDGGQVLLGQIATVRDSFQETDRFARYNAKPALMLEVYRIGDQTPMQVADAVRRRLPEIEAGLPPGMKISVEDDHSEIYGQRIELLLQNGAMGLVLVLLVLGLFLEARLGFWVMMGIPISFLGSFLLLPALGISINMMSLFAYIIALGIVVDDAIVVGENVYYYRQQGVPFLQAAVKGAREVAMPVTFSVLTNIVTFLPVYFIPGVMGKIFASIPLVVCVVFLISLIESVFVLPSHLGHARAAAGGRHSWLHEKQQAFSAAVTRWINRRYGPFLDWTLRRRYATMAMAASVLVGALSFAFSGRMGMELFPKSESDFAQADVVLPYGSPVEKTEAVMDRLLHAARDVAAGTGKADQLVLSITTDIGREGGHTGQMRVNLAAPEIRDRIMSTDEFANRWRDEVGEVPGVEYMSFASDVGGPGGHGRPVTVELSHRSIATLARASADLAEELRTYPTAKDVDDGFQPGKQQLDFKMTPEGESLGLTASEIARQVRSAFYGAQVVRQQRGRNELKIMVRLPKAQRTTEQTVHDLLIRTPAGRYVPLREVAGIRRGRAYTTIERRDGRRVVEVSADVNPRNQAGEILADLRASVLPGLMQKYAGLTYSFEGHQADMRDSIGSLKVSFVIALLIIFAMLAIPFRSYLQPLIVMTSIPFGVVGAIFGHLLMGYSLSLPSLLGIVALAGVVVNDSLVMVDFANRQQRERGLSSHDAIHSAGLQRFRPIILTTLTTFGGLAPMIFETSRQARFLIPMALSLGFGILFATLITLVLVPSLYMAVDDLGGAVARARGLLPSERAAREAGGAAARRV